VGPRTDVATQIARCQRFLLGTPFLLLLYMATLGLSLGIDDGLSHPMTLPKSTCQGLRTFHEQP